MGSKLVPDRDIEFAGKARVFANHIEADPARYKLAAEDAQAISRAVQRFRDALSAAFGKGKKTQVAVMRKDEARAACERIIRKYANIIRANPQIDRSAKVIIYVHERPTKLQARKCPKTAPHLLYMGSSGEMGMTGRKHILQFKDRFESTSRAKPAGAARLELFMELVAPGEPIPRHPGELSGGRLWYLRSFTRSPIEVEFPMPQTPMMVVYWGRWADATGEVGPFSKTVRAHVEGWSTNNAALTDQRPQRREAKLVVTVRESHDRYLEHVNTDADELFALEDGAIARCSSSATANAK